jgi:hypothetical protein
MKTFIKNSSNKNTNILNIFNFYIILYIIIYSYEYYNNITNTTEVITN